MAGIAAGVLSANPDFTPFDVDAEIKENMVQQGIDDRTPEAGLATIFFGTGGTRSPTPGPTTAPPTPPPTPCPEMDVEIKIKTDDYPDETAWTLTNQCGTGQGQTFSGGDYTAANTMHSETFCLSNSEWQFTITDEWGDGKHHICFQKYVCLLAIDHSLHSLQLSNHRRALLRLRAGRVRDLG